MTTPSRQPSHVSLRRTVVLCLFFSAIGAYVAISLVTADMAGLGQWLRDFAKSPGAAALAALVAATMAFLGISKQVSVARESLEHQREATRADSWWAMFEWTSDRAIPPNQADKPLPSTVTIDTLRSLSGSAKSDVQKSACGGMIDVLTQEEGGLSGNDSALTALASYVYANRGTPAASANAEALVYERDVVAALEALDDPRLQFRGYLPRISTSQGSDVVPDAIVEVEGRPVFIEAKRPSAPEKLRRNVVEALRRLRARGATHQYLFVSPYPAPFKADEEEDMRAVVVQWRGPQDTESLRAAIHRASTLGESS